MRIKGIVFDVGGVLIMENYFIIHKKLAKKFNLDEKDFSLVRNKYFMKSTTINGENFWYEEMISKEFGLDSKKLNEYWINLRRKYFDFNKSVQNFLKNLKGEEFILASLTNTNYSQEVVRNEIGIYDFFDVNLKSTDLGIHKPNKKIYEILVKKLNLSPEEIIFIDDLNYNLEVPKEMGINTILFKNLKQLKNDLIKLGVGVK